MHSIGAFFISLIINGINYEQQTRELTLKTLCRPECIARLEQGFVDHETSNLLICGPFRSSILGNPRHPSGLFYNYCFNDKI